MMDYFLAADFASMSTLVTVTSPLARATAVAPAPTLEPPAHHLINKKATLEQINGLVTRPSTKVSCSN